MSQPDMLESHYLNNPWKMFVSCILLNRTKRAQVDAVIDRLFEKYPDPVSMKSADPIILATMIRSLGFQNRRAKTLIRFSSSFSSIKQPLTIDSVKSLPGIGTFGLEAFRIFLLGDINFTPTDKELLKYLEWLKQMV